MSNSWTKLCVFKSTAIIIFSNTHTTLNLAPGNLFMWLLGPFFTTPTDFDSFLDVWSDKMLHFHLAHLMEADISPKSPGSWEMVFKNLSLVLVVLIASELVIVQVFVSGQS